MAPISVTLAGTSRRLAVARKLLSACWAEAPRLMAEAGTEAVNCAMREAAAAVMELYCDWICGAR